MAIAIGRKKTMTMTSNERIRRMFEHKEADRVPITDSPWNGTIARWRREGMPADADWRAYFDVDFVDHIGINVSPRYEETVLEETDDYVIRKTSWGVTLKNFKTEDSTPEFIDFTINSSDAWAEAKARMTPTLDRLNIPQMKKDFEAMRARGSWIESVFWFGFDVTHSWAVGTETLLIAMMEEPEWVTDMFETYLDMNIKLYDVLWEEGIRPDSIFWYDDMGYKQNQFFSLNTYRELLAPYHKRAIDWAHNHGIYAHLHSCGDVRPLVPELVKMGLDALNPLEVKAGMDPIALKKEFGDKLVLHGGLNAVLWDSPDEVYAEMERMIPVLKKDGGFIFSSDHSIPNSVSLADFKGIVAKAKELGKY